VIAVLPAGRGEVFVQMFSVSTDAVTPLDDALHISPAAMLIKYSTVSDLCWIGAGAIAHRDKIKAFAEQGQITFIDSNQASEVADTWRLMSSPANLAENVAMLAWRKVLINEIQDAKDLRAIYVRPSDAELKTQSIG
jgi:tRNA A37 threonylcarbamoyladenosine modification protein TsaB